MYYMFQEFIFLSSLKTMKRGHSRKNEREQIEMVCGHIEK